MMLSLLVLSILNMVLQVLAYRRALPRAVALQDGRAAAVISGSLWLLIAVWCVVQLVQR
jgi:hypothetical protein